MNGQWFLRTAALTFSLFGLAASRPAHSQQKYTVTYFDTYPFPEGWVDLNNYSPPNLTVPPVLSPGLFIYDVNGVWQAALPGPKYTGYLYGLNDSIETTGYGVGPQPPPPPRSFPPGTFPPGMQVGPANPSLPQAGEAMLWQAPSTSNAPVYLAYLPGGTFGIGLSINDSGIMVGYANFGGQFGVLHDNFPVALGPVWTFSGLPSYAVYSIGGGGLQPLPLLPPSALTPTYPYLYPLTPNSFNNLQQSFATGINQPGHIVGANVVPLLHTDPIVNIVHATFWSDIGSTPVDLGTLPGFPDSQALGISPNPSFPFVTASLVVGACMILNPAGGPPLIHTEATSWTVGGYGNLIGEPTDLGKLPGDTDSVAYGTDGYYITGISIHYVSGQPVGTAFIWDPVNGMQNLNSLIVNANGNPISPQFGLEVGFTKYNNYIGGIAGGGNVVYLLTPYTGP